MITVQVQHYLSRARDFLQGVDLLKDDLDEYKYSTALLGIHAAISYCDAMRIGLGSEKLSSEDHLSAAADLKSHLGGRNCDADKGTNRLQRLLRIKSKIAYGPFASGLDFGRIVQDAVRFAAWAELAGKTLKIEGWRDG
jgi:hypothetical protein